MQNMDVKKAALEALRKKIAKLELEAEMGDEVTAGDDLDLLEEKGASNMEESARAEAESEAASEGEDGEKGVSIEMEIESDDPKASEGMEDLYKRMAEEFGALPLSRKAGGLKKALMAGKGQKQEMFGKKRK